MRPVTFLVHRALALGPLVRLGWGAIFGPPVGDAPLSVTAVRSRLDGWYPCRLLRRTLLSRSREEPRTPPRRSNGATSGVRAEVRIRTFRQDANSETGRKAARHVPHKSFAAIILTIIRRVRKIRSSLGGLPLLDDDPHAPTCRYRLTLRDGCGRPRVDGKVAREDDRGAISRRVPRLGLELRQVDHVEVVADLLADRPTRRAAG